MARKDFLVAVIGLAIICLSDAVFPPKVQVYTRKHPVNGEDNVFQCYASGFHPPDIKIALMKNGQEMKDSQQTDMGFANDWTFKVLKYAPFTPNSNDKIECRVSHHGDDKSYVWDPSF
ncbi:beta-2-microglobulin-like [Protopterus annectens]|uniref:beta-2-microglobulin-like n=1 Tax=Protopterus annectens TaxID=7888 RepID=UPI001CFA4526|nr:beta-2-microglobulin-like [Protopterus annectens]